MSPVLGGWAGSETPPPGGTQSDLARPSPAQMLAVPCKRVADNEHLAEPESPPPYGRRADGPSVSQPPDTRTPDFATPTIPGPPSPRSAPSPVRSCGRLRGPSDSHCPLPRLRLRSLHSGQESPARRPQTAGPGTRPHGSASTLPIAPSARHSAQISVVIGQFSSSGWAIAAHSPPLSPGHTRTHSWQRLEGL